MDYLKQRQKTRRRLYSKVTIGVLVIILLLLIHPTWNIYQKSQESRKNLEQAQTELNTLENRKQQLQNDVAYIKSDNGRDQEIRDKFGVSKTGETMVVIVRDDKGKPVAETPPEPGFFARMWARFRSFFGLE